MGIKTSQTGASTTQRDATDDDGFDATDHCTPFNEATAKRANWEAFEARVLDSGNVEVVNTSHENPEDHVVHVVCDQRGVPKWCLSLDQDSGEFEDCPACKYHCDHGSDENEVDKHQWFVANQPAIVQAVREIKGDA